MPQGRPAGPGTEAAAATEPPIRLNPAAPARPTPRPLMRSRRVTAPRRSPPMPNEPCATGILLLPLAAPRSRGGTQGRPYRTPRAVAGLWLESTAGSAGETPALPAVAINAGVHDSG